MRDTPTRTPTLWLATLIVAVLFVRAPAEQAPSTSENAPAPARAAERDDKREARPAITAQLSPVHRLLARHWGLANVEGDRQGRYHSDDQCPSIVESRECIEQHARQHLRIVIASVPDPIDSHLAAGFDAQVDSFTRAAAANYFTLASWSLPWRRGELKSEASTSLPDLGRGSIEANLDENGEKKAAVAHRFEPGAILYTERSKGTEDALLFLLVGEAPTFGVHPDALSEALDLVGRLQNEHEVTFVGPTFSGSAAGLRRTLLAWGRHRGRSDWRVNIVTGSATAPNVIETLQRPADDGPNAKLTVKAHRVIHDDLVLKDAFSGYLSARDESSYAPAYLAERATEYGGALLQRPDDNSTADTKTPPPATQMPSGPTVTDFNAVSRSGTGVVDGSQLQLTYPLHLAQLRALAARRQPLEPRLKTPFSRSAGTWNSALAKTFAIYIGIPVLAALTAQMPALGRVVNLMLSAFPR